MKWTLNDWAVFQKEKDYIDTVLIPFIPIHWGEGMKGTVTTGRFTTLLAEEIERQLKGRVILNPPFTYLESESLEMKRTRLDGWIEEIKSYGIKHIICLSTDPKWNFVHTENRTIGVTNIWVPALPIDHMDSKHRQDYLDETVGQVLRQMAQAWNTN